MALEQPIKRARQDGVRTEDLRHILPTMMEHINFVGRIDENGDIYLRAERSGAGS
jgi:hypothetical protein